MATAELADTCVHAEDRTAERLLEQDGYGTKALGPMLNDARQGLLPNYLLHHHKNVRPSNEKEIYTLIH
jgi:hypothetical protein